MIYTSYLILQNQKALHTLSSFFIKAGYLVCLSENTNPVGYYIFLRMLLTTIHNIVAFPRIQYFSVFK